MALQHEIREQIQELSLLKTLVRVTGEIASARMQRDRQQTLYRRYFLDQLMGVFNEVRRGFLHQFHNLDQSKSGGSMPGQITRLAHNGKTVAVLLSANTRLYGDLLNRTFEAFFQDVTENKAEATVVGKVGLSILKERAADLPVTYFEFSDQRVDQENLGELAAHLVPYEEIHVYHGKYLNPVRQDVSEFTINADMPFSDTEKNKAYVDYIFEPSLEKVLMFFEKEIFNTLLEQTMIESQLAKHASRFVAMDRAEVQIDKELEKLRVISLRDKHITQNKRQADTLMPVLTRSRSYG
jgi:F0F1-type ATP synthase gamma subunit